MAYPRHPRNFHSKRRPCCVGWTSKRITRLLVVTSAAVAIQGVPRTSLPYCLLHNSGSWSGRLRSVSRKQAGLPARARVPFGTSTSSKVARCATSGEDLSAGGELEDGNSTEQAVPSFLPSDWRDFRAQLVAKERLDEDDVVAEKLANGSSRLGSAGRSRRVRGPSWRGGRKPDASSKLPGLALAGLVGLVAGRWASWLGDGGSDQSDKSDWAYSTPLIEKGNILLSRPGGMFAMRQEYFHKAVILIINHRSGSDVGIILNRPTALVTSQLGFAGPAWKIWFGGDCEGLSDMQFDSTAVFCLHTLEKLATSSKEVLAGVYVMSFEQAKGCVSKGEAQTIDFKVFVGYCGWGRGQLEEELDRGECWKMASVDRRVLMKELRAAPRLGLDDGIGIWQRFSALMESRVPIPDDGDTFGDELADATLRHWVEANLVERP